MSHAWLRRSAGCAAAIAITGAAGLIASDGAALAAHTAVPAATTVHGSLLTRRTGTLARGSAVPHRALGVRTYVNGRDGFAMAALTSSGGGAEYPAATTNGGHSWHTDGPALHVDAAQAPLAVTDLRAANRRQIYAYGGGQVVDVTGDGGRHWYQALFDGEPMAVVVNGNRHFVAFVDTTTGSGNTGPTLQYVSKDGGRSWHLDRTLGGS